MFRRFFITLIWWTAVAMASMSFLILRVARVSRKNVQHYHQQIVKNNVATLDDFARELNGLFSFVPDAQRLEPNSPLLLRLLQVTAAAKPEFSLLSVVGPEGVEGVRIADSRIFPAQTPQAVWSPIAASVRQEGEPAMGPVTEIVGLPILPVAYPLKEGRLLYAGINLEKLWKTMNAQKVGKSGRIVLVNAQGRPFPLMADSVPARLPLPEEGSEGWLEFKSEDGAKWIGAYARSKPLRWTLASVQPRQEAYLEAEGVLWSAALLFCLLAAASAISASRISAQIVTPLSDLIEGSSRAAANVFNVPVRESGWPELRELARRFNHMMQQLKTYQDLQVEKVIEEKAKVDALVQTIPEGILMADLQGRILFANPSVFALLGHGRTPVIAPNTAIADIIRDPNVVGCAQTLLRRDKRWAQAETTVAGAGQAETRYLKILGTLVSAGKKQSGILLLFHDVSLEKQLNQMKEDFFNSVIHDLRNPVGTIKMVLELSKSGRTLTPKEEQYYRMGQSAECELTNLLEDVLDLSKLEAGKYELAPEPTNIVTTAQNALVLQGLPAQSKNIALELTHHGTFFPIPAEPRKIQRVISNLIGNAIKFTPKGGRITVHVEQSTSEAVVSVSDTGPGIPADKLQFVFEKFKQLDLGRKEKGFGLGLTICRRFVELHKGKIWAESPPGQGAKFIFSIPVKAPAEIAKA